MNSWERFNETTLPNEKAFYSKLYREDITNKDYIHAQKVFEEFNLKCLGEYHVPLLLVDVFENFRNKYIAIYKLDAAHFLSVPGLTWSACLKSTRVKLELLTKNYMLMMIGK